MAHGSSLISRFNKGSEKGFSIVGNETDAQKGISIVGNETDAQKGISIINNNNILVEICDLSMNPLVADLTVSGGSVIDDLYTGYSDHFLTSATSSNITFSASKAGYSSDSVVVDLEEGIYQEIKLILEIQSIQFVCDTIFKNEFGATVTRPLTNGYVEVKYTGDANFNYLDYSVLFEAIPVGSTKYNSIPLGSEVIDSTVNSVTYKVDVVQSSGDYCYLSNITKNQC